MPQFYISSTKYSIQERQTKKHGKVYDVFFRVVTPDGALKNKRLSGYKTKTLAKEAYTSFVTENCELLKNNPLKKIKPEKAEPTVSELIAQYMLTLGGQNKESSIYDKQKIYKNFVLPLLGDKKITALSKEELYRWQDAVWSMKNPRTGEPYSYSYLKKIRALLSSFLEWCRSRYGYPNNLSDVVLPKRRAPKTEMQFWTKEEFDRFIEAVDDPRLHCLFTMMFYTGRRKGELLALMPEDIKGDKIVINKTYTRKTIDGSTYKITSTKADRSQTIPICKTVRDELASYAGEAPFFFGGECPLPETTITRAFRRYCKKADVKVIRIHDLRHSFVSMCIHLGANYHTVAELIGDNVEQIAKTYGHLYDSDVRDIVGRIG